MFFFNKSANRENGGVFKMQNFYYFNPKQINFLIKNKIKYEEYENSFANDDKITLSNIIDIVVTQYIIGKSLGVKKYLFLESQNEIIRERLKKEINEISTETIKQIENEIKLSTSFYVRKHNTGIELVSAKLENELCEEIRDCMNGWERIVEPDIFTAVLRSLFNSYGYSSLHLGNVNVEKQGQEYNFKDMSDYGFTLADVYKSLAR